MAKSMTGYGKSEGSTGDYFVSVEIKSVNHRYFDCSVKISKGYHFLEERLRAYLKDKISRGAVDIFLNIRALGQENVEVSVNGATAAGYISALRALAKEHHLCDDLSISSLARYPDIFSVNQICPDEALLWENVRGVAQKALADFIGSREREGDKLKKDIKGRLGKIAALIGEIEKIIPQITANYQSRLLEKLRKILEEQDIDENRLLLESAIFADKTDTTEEIVRLKSHFSQLFEMLETSQPVGRRIDFLIQEVNREVNTIAAKSMDAKISQIVVEVKAEVEKIREQVQNIE